LEIILFEQLLDTRLTGYLQTLVAERTALLQEMEALARREYIPILDLEATSFLQVLLRLVRPKRILEIGTAIGYSSILMAETVKDAQIVTIERDEERSREARKWIERSGYEKRIQLEVGDALEILQTYQENDKSQQSTFDFIFLDAAKGQYMKFFDLLLPLLSAQGVLLSDNVLFQGYVYQEGKIKHKLRTMVNRLREYNTHIAFHPKLDTTFIPLGDGMALSIRKDYS
jgi:predicted O-methyltransferase YrrM